MQAQVIRIHETGGPDVLRVEDIAVAAPGKGQVRLRQTAIGVNFTDIYNRTGLYQQPLPIVLGHEAAGVVEAVGDDVPGVKVGDRVVTSGLGGLFPADLPVGQVVSIDNGVRIELFVDLSRLDYVRIVDYGLDGVLKRIGEAPEVDNATRAVRSAAGRAGARARWAVVLIQDR